MAFPTDAPAAHPAAIPANPGQDCEAPPCPEVPIIDIDTPEVQEPQEQPVFYGPLSLQMQKAVNPIHAWAIARVFGAQYTRVV